MTNEELYNDDNDDNCGIELKKFGKSAKSKSKRVNNNNLSESDSEPNEKREESPLPWLYKHYANNEFESSFNNNNNKSSTIGIGIGSKEKKRALIRDDMMTYENLQQYYNGNSLKNRTFQYRKHAMLNYQKSMMLDENANKLKRDHYFNDSSSTNWRLPKSKQSSINLDYLKSHHRSSRHHPISQNRRVWKALKRARRIIPKVSDINIIDQYSRFAFPSLFMLFNVWYWFYYVFKSNQI